MALTWLAVCVAISLTETATAQRYEVPEATLIAYSPKGLHVSIPDSEGVQLFAFHGNINKEIVNREAGEMSVDITRPKNGRWTYYNPNIRLKVGDVINYWLYVQLDGIGHPKDDLTWTVATLVNKGGETPTPPTVTPSPPCHPSVTTTNGIPACHGQPIFEETFDGFDRSKWEHVIQFGGEPGYPFVVYTDNDRNSIVKNGHLNIIPTLQSEEAITSGTQTLDRCTGRPRTDECHKQASGAFFLPPVFSSQLRTRKSFNFRYGKVEIKAKLPLGDWIYPEIQLKPTNSAYGSSPKLASGEINLALVRGNKELTYSGQQIGAVFLESFCDMAFQNTSHRQKYNQRGTQLWGDSFHVYGMLWTPDSITFTVDGKEIGKMVAPNGGLASQTPFSGMSNIPWSRGSKLAPFDQEFYITLGLAVGGFVEFPDNCFTSNNKEKPWKNWKSKAVADFWMDKDNWLPTWSTKAVLQIDYVKVTAL